jgi:DNA-directed RNA polymerase III subunit RPC2
MRRQGKTGEFVSVYLNLVQKAVYVASDGGRVCRPLLVVESGRILMTQDHIRRLGNGLQLEELIAQGIIEYVDVRSQLSHSHTPPHHHIRPPIFIVRSMKRTIASSL